MVVTVSFDRNSHRFTGITPDDLAKWAEAYPQVDIRPFVARMEVWLEHNPSRGYRNWGRFLTNNLSREQARSGVARLREQALDKHIAEDRQQEQQDRDAAQTERAKMAAALDELDADSHKALYKRTMKRYPGLQRANRDSMVVRMSMYHLMTNNGKEAEGTRA